MEATQNNGNTNAKHVETQPINELKIGLDFKTDGQGYGGYVIVERGFGTKTGAGLILPASTKFEVASLVHHVGAECRHGVQVGDVLEYQQATELGRGGPNGGKMFAVPENQIVTVKTHDGRTLEKYTPPLQEQFRDDLAMLGRRVSALDGMPVEFESVRK